MAFTLAGLQSQVQLACGHDGLVAKVATWANRTCYDFATRAYWQRSMTMGFAHPTGATSLQATAPGSQWFSLNATNANDTANCSLPVNVYAVDQVHVSSAITQAGSTTIADYVKSVVRYEVGDLYQHAANASPAGQTGTSASFYAIGKAQTNTNPVPKFAVYPFFANSTVTTGGVGALAVTYLASPAPLVNSGDTNWMLRRYFGVVLAGVMRHVRLYLGDPQGYLLAKGEFENGVKDALLHEEVATLHAPAMRGIDSQLANLGDS